LQPAEADSLSIGHRRFTESAAARGGAGAVLTPCSRLLED
jgi:hypothetical protein